MEAVRKKQEEENMEAARKKQEEENMEAARKLYVGAQDVVM